ncbi:MAG: 2,3-bisphosphoglycerate-independent phosphoglycerate mutase [Deltaproteobacteria bacterium]|jgi:2,3-bisphosphoglycerate-independent phosphoglycerate mutase|nr:2,3-bisphosphoglycerate-independent phosphoglycerate mutase [Deltaproteobacteria bacterium]
MANPVCLIIRDGWGHREDPYGNAVLAAKTPFMDRLLADKSSWTLLEAAGEPVGLPAGYQGSSEVGHLNMGAGRIVIQELKRIDDGLRDGTFFQLPKWRETVDFWRQSQGTLHLMGLLQDEGVHAHQEHLFKILRQARKENPTGRLTVHPFLDGRDTPPRSSPEFIAKLELVLKEVGLATVGVMMGRYYAMDRSRDWALTDLAYAALVYGKAKIYQGSPIAAVERAWAEEKTPDNFDMVDEYIPPLKTADYQGFAEGDAVFHFNFRQDRAIQLTQAMVDPQYPGKRTLGPKVKYLGLTRYYDEFTEYLLGPMGGEGGMSGLLGEVVSQAGLKQLRLAETQKFRHVTSFFNGKSTKPFPLEEQVEIPGRFEPATFASHPEMEAEILSETFLTKYLPQDYPLIVINYANCDMVGHTGVLGAAVKAVEAVDAALAKIVPPLLAKGYQVLITADHGNAEEMIDPVTNLVKTSHTLFPVECVYVAAKPLAKLSGQSGKLADLAPTILELMGLEVPKEMTATSLLAKRV